MKTYLSLLSAAWTLLAAGCVGTQAASVEPSVPVAMVPAGPPPPPPSGAEPGPAANVTNAPEPGSMDELVAPIALYPDALVALILPAATASSDVVLAARYLTSGGDPKEVESRAWDDSVKALTHYPDVIKWMDENLAWTQRLGEAYLNRPEEVMAAIQRDRARAQANGVLANNPQQQVVADAGAIRIIPAQPDVIYVPRYDPEIIYVERPVYVDSYPWITFGIGFGVGGWLAYDCDWHHRTIWIDPYRRERWHDRRHDWRQPHFPGGSGGIVHGDGWRRWAPPPGRRPPHFADRDRWHREPIRPRPMPGTPGMDRHRDRRDRSGEHARGADTPDFRPGARVPRPVVPERQRDLRPDGFAQRTPNPRVDRPRDQGEARRTPPGEHRRWDGQGRRERGPNPGNRPVIAPPPAPSNGQASVQPRPQPDSSGRRGGPNHDGGRRFNPPGGERRPIAPAPQPRVDSAPIAQAGHRVPAVQQAAPPPNVAPRPQPASPPPPRAQAPAPAESRPQFTPGARVPRPERQESDRSDRGGRGRERHRD